MLTQKEYNQIWVDYFAIHLPAGTIVPDYSEYAMHENMLEDYLDLFRGSNTRGDSALRQSDTLDESEHPYLQELGSRERKVRFILVAEARPNPAGGIAAYFYNYGRAATPYLNAVQKATYAGLPPAITGGNASERLLDLANRGVLLLDLYPFARAYKTMERNKLCKSGTTLAAWNGTGALSGFSYNIESRIQALCRDGLLSDQWDLILTAPPKTTCCVLNNAGHFQAHQRPFGWTSSFGIRRSYPKPHKSKMLQRSKKSRNFVCWYASNPTFNHRGLHLGKYTP